MPVQTPVSVDFSPRMSIDHQMDTQMERLQQMDGPDSQSLSDSAEAVTEEVKRRRQEVRTHVELAHVPSLRGFGTHVSPCRAPV